MLKYGLGCLGLAMAGAAIVVVLLVSLLTGLMGLFGSAAGGSGGAQVCSATPPPTPTASSTGCLAPTALGAAVVNLAEQMANALYVSPSCNGVISYPNCYDTWYDSSFPPSVIAYGKQVCAGCSAWANGTYQCVSFVRGAYGPLYPMAWTANAFDLWALYQGKPGWQEIPSAAGAASARGMPLPGDVMVFKDSSVGHVAIVISVVPPGSGKSGSITFANANSPTPSTRMPLLPDLSVDASAWPGYTVWGYLRPARSVGATPTPTP